MTLPLPHRRLAAIMFTDMTGYSALSQRDESRALALLAEHNCLVREKLAASHGKEIKTVGDAFLVEFSSALDATKCAISIQRAIYERNVAHEADPGMEPLHIRIGIHLGDVVYREGDVFGDGVNIAARIEAAAPPDGICVSEDVARQVQNKIEAGLINLGKGKLKNINLPVDVYAVQLPWFASTQDATPGMRQRRRVRQAMLIAVPLVLLVAVGGWWYQSKSVSSAGNTVAVAEIANSIAVLPFVDMSQAKDQEHFADGLSEELLNLLARVPQLKVIARTSSFSFKGKNADIATIAKALNVATVLEGSVRKSADGIRVTAQLIRASDSAHLWSETYDRKIADTFAIQDDVANAVVDALKIKLLPSQRASRTNHYVPLPQAYDQYLLGRQLMQSASRKDGARAVEVLAKAVELDRNYAAAHTALAMSIALRWGGMDPAERMRNAPLAFAAAEMGVSLNPESGDAYATRAYLRYTINWDWAGAESDLSKARQLDTNDAKIPLKHSVLQAAMGKIDLALKSLKMAAELDPLFYPIRSEMTQIQIGMGDYVGARHSALRAQSLRPDNQSSSEYILSLVSLFEGDAEKAKRGFLQESDEARRLWGLAAAEYSLGNDAASRQALAQFSALRSNAPYAIASLHAWRGELDAAFGFLDSAVAEHSTSLIRVRYDPMFAKLRNDPRFALLLKRIGLPAFAK